MRAMILAAGRGERLRPLTDTTPKPLIKVGAKRLIEYHLEGLAAAGFKEIVINVSHLGAQLQDYLGDGQNYGVKIKYSIEPEALETGGGIMQALPLLGNAPFLVVNGDIWTDYPFAQLQLPAGDLASTVLVANPAHVPNGNFALENGRVVMQGNKLTYAGITCYHPDFFAGQTLGRFSVVPLLEAAIAQKKMSGVYYTGTWFDIGSIERLAVAEQWLQSQNSQRCGAAESSYGLEG